MSSVGHQLLAFSIAFLSGTSGPSTEYPFVVVLMGVLLRSGLVDVRSLLVRGGLGSALPGTACLNQAQPCVAVWQHWAFLSL